MPRLTRLFGRRAGPLGIALTAYDVWRRIPPKQRQRIIQETRKHAPRVAAELKRRTRRRGGPEGPRPR